MYQTYKRYADEFFAELEWGVIVKELIDYLNKKHGADISGSSTDPAVKRAYSIIAAHSRKKGFKQWGDLHRALLQHAGGSLFGGTHGRARGTLKIKLKEPQLRDNTLILASKAKYAWARLFFEIEEDINEMVRKGIVAEQCGYQVIKTLYYSEEPLNMKLLMGKLGYSTKVVNAYQIKFKKTHITPLRELAMLQVKDDKIQLAPVIRKSYKHMLSIQEDLQNWEYRGKGGWILPRYS